MPPAIEYGLIVALISIAIIGGMTFFADQALGLWAYIVDSLSPAS